MENYLNQSPAIPKWFALLIEAVAKPSLIMKAYRFDACARRLRVHAAAKRTSVRHPELNPQNARIIPDS